MITYYITVEFACGHREIQTHGPRSSGPLTSCWRAKPCPMNSEAAPCQHARTLMMWRGGTRSSCWGNVNEVREIRPMRRSRR